MDVQKILGEAGPPGVRVSIVLMVDVNTHPGMPDLPFCWLAKRAPSDVYPCLAGLYETGGGKCEVGESYENAAIREMREETGLRLNLDELVNFGLVRYRRTDFNVELALYMVYLSGREPQNNEPHKRGSWTAVPLMNLGLDPEEMTPATSVLVDMVLLNLGLLWGQP